MSVATRQSSVSDVNKHRDVSRHSGIEIMSAGECQRLLAEEVIGRVAVVIGRTPMILPVNYALDGEDIVMRAQTGSRLDVGRGRASFEIDHFDREGRVGWSVLVTGELEGVGGASREDRQRIQALPIAPWPAGERNLWLRLRPSFVTGRVVRGDADQWQEAD